MRFQFYLPMALLILLGGFASRSECQVSKKSPQTPAVNKIKNRFFNTNTVTPVESGRIELLEPTETVNNLNNQLNGAFENAVSQFPQQQSNSLPGIKQQSNSLPGIQQDTATFLERPRTNSQPSISAPPNPNFLNRLDQPNRFQNASSTITGTGNESRFSGSEPLVVGPSPLEQSHAPVKSSPAGFRYSPAEQFRANPAAAIDQWIAPQTPALAPQSVMSSNFGQAQQQVQGSFQAFDESINWWRNSVMQPFDGTRSSESVDSNMLVYRALENSPRIQAVSQDPLIRELQIVEADSEFDATQFVRSQFEDRVDPVGNSLTVGSGENFLKDNIWSADLGLRRKSRNGASWELNQRLGFQNSNSTFFVPQDQGTATLALNVTQPLLRGRGKYVNQSQILIAQATNGAAWQTFHAELQDELLGVVSSYWDLYLTRSIYLQKQRNVSRGEKILVRLEGRSELDSLPSQIARARSSVQTRRTELANALRDVRNAETEVRRRTADTSWLSSGATELIPGELPTTDTFRLPLEQVVYEALQHRPEIHEALGRARIASVQRDVSSNELLPELSLLFGTYVSALRADTGIENAFQDQFGQVKPGYSLGFNFEMPYGNRAARSRLAQRQLQVKKIKAEVDEVLQNVIAESQIALRRVESASETLLAATAAIQAAHADRDQFEQRWENFALVEGDLADGQNPTTVLDQLLDSQDRLASAELVYVEAERELKVSEVALQRAMGTLLMRQRVSTARGYENDLPRVDIFKEGSSLSQVPTNVFHNAPAQVAPQFAQPTTQFRAPSQATLQRYPGLR